MGVSDIKKRLKEQGYSGDVGRASEHYGLDTLTSDGKYRGSSSYQKIKDRVKNEGVRTDSFGVDQKYIDSFINDANSYISSAQNDYNAMEWKTSSSVSSSRADSYSDLYNRGQRVLAYVKANKGNLDKEDYDSFISSMESTMDALYGINNTFAEKAGVYAKYKSEEDYNNAIAYAKDIEEKTFKYDLEKGSKEIESWESILGEAQSYESDILDRKTYLATGNSNSGVENYSGVMLDEYKSFMGDLYGRYQRGEIDEETYNRFKNNNYYKYGLYDQNSKYVKQDELEDYIQWTIDTKEGNLNNLLAPTGSGTVYDLEEGIREKKLYHQDAERLQYLDYTKWWAESAKDFELVTSGASVIGQKDLADKVLSAKQTAIEASKTAAYNSNRPGNTELKTESVNAKNTYDTLLAEYESLYGSIDNEHYLRYMKDDELKVYTYYIKQGDTETANAYLDSLKNELTMREGREIYDQWNDNYISELFFGAAAGLEQFGTGVANYIGGLFGADPTPTTATQYASQLIREDLKDVDLKWYNFKTGEWNDQKILGNSLGQIGYDAANTLGNQLPSILVGSVTGGVGGAITMGVSAAGNGYAEMVNLGYSKDQAMAYGSMVGIAEAGLSYILGGISQLGGKASGGLVNHIANKVDNAIGRVAIKIGGNMIAEGLEESLQEILDPWFKTLATGDIDWESPTIDEVLYSGLLGALSAGFLESGRTIRGDIATTKTGQKVQNAGMIDRLVKVGSTFSADSVAYKIASKVNENTGAYTIGRLLNEVNATLTQQNVSDIVSALESKGVSSKDAQTIAQGIEMVVEGQALTKNQASILENNDVVSEVMLDVIINQNSTVNQRIKGFAEVVSNVNNFNKTTSEISQADVETVLEGYSSPESTKAEELTNSPTKEETPGTAEIQSYFDGKTRLIADNSEVTVENLDSIKDGESFVRLDNGNVVSRNEVQFGKNEEGLVYDTVVDLGLGVDNANIIIQDAKQNVKGLNENGTISIEDYVEGVRNAYLYGNKGFASVELTVSKKTNYLPEASRKVAYNEGRTKAITEAKETQKAFREMKSKVEEAKKVVKNKKTPIESTDSVRFHEVDKSGLTGRQKASIDFVDRIAKVFSKSKFVFFASYKDANGKRVYKDADGKIKSAPSGKFLASNGEIWIDINAGNLGNGLILFTASHELTHFAKKFNPEQYEAFTNFLMKQYGKLTYNGVRISVDQLVERQIAKAKSKGREISYDEAFDEVVADSCERFLMDSNAIRKLSADESIDKGTIAKIKSFIRNLISQVKAWYRGLNPESLESHLVSKMDKESINKLVAMWENMVSEAGENYQILNSNLTVEETQVLTDEGIGYDVETETVYALRDSFATNSDIVVNRKTFDVEKVAQLVAKATNRSIEDARKWVNSEITIANIVMANPEFLDFEADSRYEAIKKNSDYPQGTVDLSNLCPKRTEFTAMFDMLQRKYPDKLFTASDVAEMRTILSNHDITVACGACFVEDRRQLLGEIADTYINMWKEAVETGKGLHKVNAEGVKKELFVTADIAKKYGLVQGSQILATDTYIPTQYDLTTYEGFKLLEKNHPTIAMGFVRYNNSRGQQAGRLIEGRAEYKRDVLGWSDAKVRSVNNVGGLRIFSFSDFEVVHLLDLVQVIIDCAAKGVKIQGYTKIPAFARLVRDTGIKINRSLIPKGDTGIKVVNGKKVLDIDTVEGIDINDENFLDESDNPNVGNIIIGINPEQIGIAFLDDFIDYIIPFHSNKAMAILKKLGVGTWVNYKESQHEKDIATGKASKHNVNIYTQVINKYHPTNKVEFVNAFLKECKAQGKIPRYSEFLNIDENGDFAYREGYHKLIVDFKMFDKDGNILPQEKVEPNLDNEFMADLLAKEVDKKKNYEFPEDVYKEIDQKFGQKEQLSDRDSTKEAKDFVDHIKSLARSQKWTVANTVKYVDEHPELNFIERIFKKDKQAKADLDEFLNGIDDTKLLYDFEFFMATAYSDKDAGFSFNTFKNVYPYRGAVTIFKNAIKRRINAIMVATGGGTNLNIKNGDVSLQDVKSLFGKLNTNTEMVGLAEKVFATSQKLGVNIRFANELFGEYSKNSGVAWGDMVIYKTSVFNDASVSDQDKAGVILHELIHVCTTYAMRLKTNPENTAISTKSDNYKTLVRAAQKLKEIYNEVKNDTELQGEYGLNDEFEFVAELANVRFVGKLKKRNLFWRIVDAICDLFGFSRGTTAYDNARMCLDYILDNPDIAMYKAYATGVRDYANRTGKDVFGETRYSDSDTSYSLRDVDPVIPTSNKWQRTFTTQQVKTRFPKLWDVTADESEVRNPTQISGTVKSYRKVYDYLKEEGFNGTILDASSGLGYGTRAGIEEYGFKVEDIEPYPDKSYKPKYTDYSKLNKKYDVIISNAVLNVIPQDQRDALVVKMGELLKDGGRMFINVRGDDVKNASSKVAINEDLMEYYISQSGSYQKGFTKSELVAYLQDALGEGFTVKPISWFGKTSAIVTKNEGQVLYSDRTSFSSQVDDVLNGKFPRGNAVYVGATPKILQDVGLNGDLPMLTTAKHIKKAVLPKDEKLHNHGLTVSQLKSIPEKIAHPVMIMDSLTEANCVVVVTDMTDSNGDPIVVAVKADGKGMYNNVEILANFMLSYYPKANFHSFVNSNIEADSMLFIDKEKSRKLSNQTKVQFFGKLEGYDFNTIIRKAKAFVKQNTENSDTKFQDRDSDSMSNRYLLANALETAVTNDIEKNKLAEYKKKVDLIEKEERRLSEIRDQLFGKSEMVSEKTRKALQFEMKQTSNRINTYDRQLLNLESTSALKKVLEREKRMAYKRAEQKGRDAVAKQREKNAETVRTLMNKYQQQRKDAVNRVRETRDKNDAKETLQKLVLKTAKWISYPDKDDVKCPDILRQPYADFLKSIDLSSKRKLEGGEDTKNDLRIASAMDSLATAIEKIKVAQDPSITTDNILDSGYLDLPAEFVEKLREMAESVKGMMVEGDHIVNQMSSGDIKALSQLIRTLNHAIKEMSTLYNNLRFAKVEELGDNSMTFMDSMGEAKGTNGVGDFIGWDNALPYYAFQRFGEGGESVFEELMDAQDQLAYHAKTIFEFKDKNWTDKEADSWSKDTHTVELTDGKTATGTTADFMGVYCLSRREQAVPHLLGGGIRIIGSKKGTKQTQDSRTNLTEEDIKIIVKSLSERQIKVANAIQEFMSTVCADWGNEISMKRFLTEEFTEKFYYPIESNDENLAQKDPQAKQSDLYRLLNISATKPTVKGANNEVIIRNIFDVFTNHASDMARLNAYGMALLDYMKWLNYREKIDNADGSFKVRGVVKSMGNTYGDKAKSYVVNLIKDINGRSSDGKDHPWLMEMTRMAKTASVGGSLRVAMLQVTAYPRAAMVLSMGSLAKGLTKVPSIRKAQEYCGIALWKSFGFYDTNIARSIEDQIRGAKNIRQKIIELSLKGAEWADAVTWGALWNACEYEVAKTTKNKVGSEEFYKEVGKKLREVVYATQVVDSTLTRTQIMRSKSGLTQTATAFMSEPSLTHNILMNAAFQFHKEKRISGSAKVAWKKTGKLITKTISVYSSTALLVAIMESLADAYRDDDDEEFIEKFKEAFTENSISNIVPFNNIPIISDIANLILSQFDIGYFSSDRLDTTWLTQANDAIRAWKEVIAEWSGEKETSKTPYNAIYNTVRALSSVTGLPIANLMREVVTLWNNTAGEYDPTLKIKMYESTDEELRKLLYDAIVEGKDQQLVDNIKEDFGFENEKEYKSALSKALRENDSRIHEAGQAYYEGDLRTYKQILNDIVDEGYFTEEVVESAIQSEASAIKTKAEEGTSKPDTDEPKDTANSIFKASDINTAFESGDTDFAKEIIADLVDTMVANGKTEKEARSSLRSSMTSYWKPLYKQAYKNSNSEEMRRIRYILYNSGLYGTGNDVVEAVQGWLKEN